MKNSGLSVDVSDHKVCETTETEKIKHFSVKMHLHSEVHLPQNEARIIYP